MRPQWITKGEEHLNCKRSNTTYFFKIVSSVGSNLQEMREKKEYLLSNYLGQSNKISATAEGKIENTSIGDEAKSSNTFKMTYQNDVSSDVFYARLVDEYWHQISDTEYEYSALFAVSENGQKPVFDDFETTTSYGVAPVLMSVIPGFGQWHKGSKAKGVCLFAAEAVAVASIIVCDNQRASYIKKMKEQPKFAKQYNSKADNWETGRNIGIGVAAGVWIYNIIDAAVARGARKVSIKRPYDAGLSFAPTVFPDGGGVTFAYRF